MNKGLLAARIDRLIDRRMDDLILHAESINWKGLRKDHFKILFCHQMQSPWHGYTHLCCCICIPCMKKRVNNIMQCDTILEFWKKDLAAIAEEIASEVEGVEAKAIHTKLINEYLKVAAKEAVYQCAMESERTSSNAKPEG